MRDIDDEPVVPVPTATWNSIVFGGFAFVAVAIAVVGVAGVLAWSVSARLRELGIRLAIGSRPWDFLTRVVAEGAVIAVVGILGGCLGVRAREVLRHLRAGTRRCPAS
ncbi:MAG TPA: FtsX-like permease family protein [Vicinamibacteria bacterium]|nr:FtsX-like permease family protein [Vicinamibacteria bacterium]